MGPMFSVKFTLQNFKKWDIKTEVGIGKWSQFGDGLNLKLNHTPLSKWFTFVKKKVKYLNHLRDGR